MATGILFGSYGDLGATVAGFFHTPEDVISMFPFLALSVFNFYVSMSELFMQDMSKTEPKVESVDDLRSKRWVLWSYLRTSRTCSVGLCGFAKCLLIGTK